MCSHGIHDIELLKKFEETNKTNFNGNEYETAKNLTTYCLCSQKTYAICKRIPDKTYIY